MRIDSLGSTRIRRMRWGGIAVAGIIAGFAAGCASQDNLEKAFVQDQITGWIVECGPEPFSITFCIDFYKERGYVEVSAP